MQINRTTTSAKATERLGEAIGSRLRGGEVLELVSDLGGGKTTFTRGLAKGFGSDDRVSSPSFTLSREYVAGSKRICHFDLYRLPEAGIMAAEIAELVNDPDVVLVVEWADVAATVLPAERVTITLQVTAADDRNISLSAPPSLAYVLEGVA